MSAKDSALLREFHASIRIQDQRREVALPKKHDIILPNNRTNAERRLGNLRRRLDNNEALKETYYAHMVDYREGPSGSGSPGRDGKSSIYRTKR
jgi:hypothetical protein